MAHVALVLGDQLMADNPALDGAGSVVMVESLAVLGRAPLHRIRAQLVLSAMRHHA
ncbi:MAG: cryptochrome/photolyase family protein, partial [Solirubrobacterales bacterium]